MLSLFRCMLMRLRDPFETKAEDDAVAATEPRRRPHLVRMLSEDDAMVPSAAAEEKDMHTWMAEEDQRREELFAHPPAVASSPRRRLRQSTAGAHVGFQLAQRTTERVYCCGACGAWLMRSQDLIKEADRAAEVSLDDSRLTLCTASADVFEAEGCEVEASGGWRYTCLGVRCTRCKAFLGIKLRSMRKAGERFSHAEGAAHADSRGVRVQPPNAAWLRSVSPPASERASPHHSPHNSPLAQQHEVLHLPDARTCTSCM